MKQKGVYPYEYMNSSKKFFNDNLPDWSKFYSSLKEKQISEKDYLHAIDYRSTLERKTVSDYHDVSWSINRSWN